MNAFAALADPMRRRIVELLTHGESAAGDLGAVVQAEFGVRQPAVSNQLRTLREAQIVTVRADGARRLYRLSPGALDEVTDWVERYSSLWPQRLDALDTEIHRGKRSRSTSRERP